jgi:redox-sensitive bicupin YhaK (pirin superfamily)
MWLAQPEATRHGQSRFEHIEDLPVVDLPEATARVFAGELGEARSPALLDWETAGMDVLVRGRKVELPIAPGFEHAVVPIDRAVKVEEAIVEPGWLALVPPGNEALPIETQNEGARFLLLGGEPLGEPIEMWWNFVARSKDEITEAWRAWQEHDEDRFGEVPSQLARIDAPPPPWLPAP